MSTKLKTTKFNPLLTNAKSILSAVPTSYLDRIVCKLAKISYNVELEKNDFHFVVFKDFSYQVVPSTQLVSFFSKSKIPFPYIVDVNSKKVIDLFIEEVHLPSIIKRSKARTEEIKNNSTQNHQTNEQDTTAEK